ncbi:hypothetical protein F4821DRAFT_275689 [Hypoxylon rubiginosum]|uniref:Uncharacterized protein n=1 Tax=Hypoxylon rubiginosum TaxID=110542 RepID=A0ACC0CJU9_9PEZI|nr:hypothetical protein F4821DRAFT_275689 [Hypoxylon rubiginosum]
MVLAAGFVSLTIAICLVGGLGYHLTDLSPETTTLFWKINIAGQVVWAAANTCVKFSILSLYTGLFPNNKLARICYVLMAFSMAYLISVSILAFLLCEPVTYNWDKTIPDGTCNGVGTSFLAAGITNLVLDAFIVALPMPLLFRLHMSLPKRLMVASMFSLGGIICILSLLRIIFVNNWDLTDVTYTAPLTTIFTILEPTLGVVNASLPVMKPALDRIFHLEIFNWTKEVFTGCSWSNTTNVNTGNTSQDRLPPSANKSGSNGRSVQLSDGITLPTIPSRNSTTGDMESENIITVTRGWEVDSHRESIERIMSRRNELLDDVENCRGAK